MKVAVVPASSILSSSILLECLEIAVRDHFVVHDDVVEVFRVASGVGLVIKVVEIEGTKARCVKKQVGLFEEKPRKTDIGQLGSMSRDRCDVTYSALLFRRGGTVVRYEKGDLATKYETTKESMTQMILLIAKMSEKVFITPP